MSTSADKSAAQGSDDSLAGANYSPEKIPASGGIDWMKLLVWFGPAAFVALAFLIGWLA